MPVQGASGRADYVDLNDQRRFEADQQEKGEDHTQDRIGVGRVRDPRVVESEERVDVGKRAGEVEGHAEQPGGVEEQGSGVQDANCGLAPVGPGHEG